MKNNEEKTETKMPILTKEQCDKLISLKDGFNYLTFDDMKDKKKISKYL